MQLRLTTDRTDRGREQRAGDVIEVSASEGRSLLESRQAEIVTPADAVETAESHRRPRRNKSVAQ